MEQSKCYENYPLKIPIISLSFMVAIYAIGMYIISGFGIIWGILYLCYCVGIELLVLKKSCVDCYYYDKVCGLGKGKICAKLFKKGDNQKFSEREVSWKWMLPDFLTIIFPIVGAVILLANYFTPILLTLLIILIGLYFVGNALIRGSLTCNHCKQRELGCPAADLFMEKEK